MVGLFQKRRDNIVTVGLPRSGKSTWATAKAMVRTLFYAGHDRVILDATSITRKRRDEWLSREWGTFFKLIDTPKEICLERAISANDMDILPVIERMTDQFEPLGDDENLWPSVS